MRRALLWLHRVVGLATASFLAVAGLTGALLAGYHAMDAALNPTLLRAQPPEPGAQPLDPLLLRERVQAMYPQALVHHAPLHHQSGESAVYFLRPARHPVTGAPMPLLQDEVFIDPFTGRWLGHRLWGAFDAGWRHAMPMIYRVHMDLGLGRFGHHLLGIVALVWTMDCFIGAALTLPKPRRSPAPLNAVVELRNWVTRWWQAWILRPGGSGVRLVFDLHRAGGLWSWLLLFVFAWSSVAFNLGEVYEPVMKTLLPSQETYPPAERRAREGAMPMPWPEALVTGRQLMADFARTEVFTIEREHRLSLDERRGLYHYRVKSDRDLRERRAVTMVSFDATSGELFSRYVPTGAAAGDTSTSWLVSLHLADLGGTPYKGAVAVLGLIVAGLSGTGVWLWWRKRLARRAARRALRRP